MKKSSFIVGMIGTMLLAQSSFAQPSYSTHRAPIMRGELTAPISHANTANLLTTPVAGVPAIEVNIGKVEQLPTILISADKTGNTQLDVTLIDEFIDDISPNARHYPPNFPNRTSEYIASETLQHLSDWLEPYASSPNASFDVVLRAAKINGMARNLNIGTDYSLRANNHMAKAIKLMPSHPEANFLYGMMISEAGGFKEGQKYLEKAASLGYLEAEQSLAQTELLSDKKSSALVRLKALQAKHPDNAQIAEQVRIVEGGDYYIWNIKDANLSIKHFK